MVGLKCLFTNIFRNIVEVDINGQGINSCLYFFLALGQTKYPSYFDQMLMLNYIKINTDFLCNGTNDFLLRIHL